MGVVYGAGTREGGGGGKGNKEERDMEGGESAEGAVLRQKSREVKFGAQVGKVLSFYIAPLDGVKE